MNANCIMTRLAIAGGTLALAMATPAGATQIFDFPNFSGACEGSQLSCVGNTATTGGGVLRLTPATGGQSGAAYSNQQVSLGANATFSTTFQFQFTSPGGIDPADGIVFVLSTSTSGLGSPGFGIGYSGATPTSVGIEFDTFNDDGKGISNGGGGNIDDTSSNHVAIDTKGVLTNTASTNVYGVANCTFANGYANAGTNTDTYKLPGCMSNGDIWTVTIGYDGAAKSLSIVLQDGSMVSQTIAPYSIDLASLLGTTSAFVGFTSGTGAGWENHDILDWQFNNDLSLAPPPVTGPPAGVPEPLSVALMGIGFVGLAAARRRRG